VAPSVRAVGLVLAAGAGTRLGAPKAELVLNGERLIERAVRVLAAGGCTEVVAVVRASFAGDINARKVVNVEPERGQRSSLALGIDAAIGADLIVVLPVDMPGIAVDAVAVTLQAWRPGRMVVATYDGLRAHPVAMSPTMWREALELADADEGARRYLNSHPELVDEVVAIGDPRDIDTMEDLNHWTQSSR